MVIIASFVFASIAVLAMFAIVMTISGALPRIKQVVIDAHDSQDRRQRRTIHISLPVATTAQIIPLNAAIRRQKAVADNELKVAA